tara:strand:+ start:7642 stop:8289 length:648 start_codon:yes stop_codon:yes gene_type:complete
MGIIYSLFIDAKLKNDLSLEIHKSFRNKKKKNIHLILDIDCTLLYASNIKDDRFNYIPIYLNKNSLRKKKQTFYVYLRPNLQYFLEYCFDNFKSVSLWSLGHKSYVNRINNLLQSIYNIPKFEKVLSRSDYTFDNTFSDFEIFQPRMNILSKNLQRLFNDKNDFNQNNTLFVDDTINVHENNFKNLIQIRRFGSISHILYDTELSDLINKFYEMC